MSEIKKITTARRGRPPKDPNSKDPSSEADQNRKAKALLARKAIEKKTSQKAVTACFSTYPHITSGSFAIDDLIGGSMALDGKGRVCPGYPRRRITEIFGPESSGKTTVALHAIAEAQKMGGLAMFLDFEHALDHAYARKVGVSFDDDKLLLYAPDTFEEGIQIINIGLQAGVDLIVIDSVPSMVPQEEMEAQLDKESRFGALARALGKNLPKLTSWLNNEKYLTRNPEGTAVIFLNQERANIGSQGRGDKTKTTGGYAMKFYTSLRLKFNGIGKESVKRKNRFTGKEVSIPYGTLTQVKVVKNKIDARQGQTHTIFIRYGIGIDDIFSLIEAAAYHKVVQKGGAFYTYKEERFQGRETFRKYLLDNPSVFEEIRAHLLSIVQGEAEPSEDDEVTSQGFDEDEEEELETQHVEHSEMEVDISDVDTEESDGSDENGGEDDG